jgi:hypothetical protein
MMPEDSSVHAHPVTRRETKHRVPKGKESKRPTETPQPTKPMIEKNEEPQRSKYQATVEDEREDTGFDARPEEGPRDIPGLSTEAGDNTDRLNTARERQKPRGTAQKNPLEGAGQVSS